MIEGKDLTDKMLEGIPAEIRVVMGWDTILSANVLTPEEENTILFILQPYLDKGEDMEVDFDYDAAMGV